MVEDGSDGMDLSEDNNNHDNNNANDNHDGMTGRKRRHADSAAAATAHPLTPQELLDLVENPNFELLARRYPAFRSAWEETRQIQRNMGPHATFSSCVTQNFTIALTRALLGDCFRLKLPYLDEQHLCPPVPNRFFYVKWVHEELLYTNNNNNDNGPINNVVGLDLGAGASCIYPLLICRVYRTTTTRVFTSEVDPQAAQLARANVTANHLNQFIQVIDVPPSHAQQGPESPSGGPLQRTLAVISNETNTLGRLDFVMTNPPFYDSSSLDVSTARAGDGRIRTHMTVSEGAYPGGEVGFVHDILRDFSSMGHSQRPRWCSAMLGKKASFMQLHKLLVHIFGPAKVKSTEYGPGQYTRWFLAWTTDRPMMRDPGAAVPPNPKDAFIVTLDTEDLAKTKSFEKAVQKILDRITDFCQSCPGGWELSAVVTHKESTAISYTVSVSLQEREPKLVTCYVNESLDGGDSLIPPKILEALLLQDPQMSQPEHFLPREGHFLVDMTLRANNRSTDKVEVHLSSYRHSARGAKAIEKIYKSLEGEICRTNRKWRKIRQRQQKTMMQ